MYFKSLFNSIKVKLKTNPNIKIDKIILNQIIKCLNQIISENKPYNLRPCTFTLHM